MSRKRMSAEKKPDPGRNQEGGTRLFTLERDCEGLMRPMEQ